RIGVLWMAADGKDAWEQGSLTALKEANIPYERLSTRELAKGWPQINFESVAWGVFEPQSGFLRAQLVCLGVEEGFLHEGGSQRQAAGHTDDLESGRPHGLTLSDGRLLKADLYIFACGPWLGRLFPHAIGSNIRATRQEVFFFGPPAGDVRFNDQHLPV